MSGGESTLDGETPFLDVDREHGACGLWEDIWGEASGCLVLRKIH